MSFILEVSLAINHDDISGLWPEECIHNSNHAE